MNRLRPGGARHGERVHDGDGCEKAASTVDTVVETMSVDIDDDDDADLLSLLPECHAFLERSKPGVSPSSTSAGDDEHSTGTSSGSVGAVLVYCSAGMSRSQAVAASFLMRIEGLSLHSALAQLPQHASPNENFLAQLLLLEKMGGTVNVDSKVFRAFRQKRIARRTLMYGYFNSDDVNDLDYGNVIVDTDPGAHRHTATTGKESVVGVVYRCRKCRRIVASSSNEIGSSPDDNNVGAKERDTQSTINESQIYTEAITWMREELEKVHRTYALSLSHTYTHPQPHTYRPPSV